MATCRTRKMEQRARIPTRYGPQNYFFVCQSRGCAKLSWYRPGAPDASLHNEGAKTWNRLLFDPERGDSQLAPASPQDM